MGVSQVKTTKVSRYYNIFPCQIAFWFSVANVEDDQTFNTRGSCLTVKYFLWDCYRLTDG